MLISALVLFMSMFIVGTKTALGEHEPWNCPDCGRKENKGNYCGECEYPAPWTDPEAWKDDTSDNEAKRAAFHNVGGYVTFGSYEQDNNTANGSEPIEWLVLDYDDTNNSALLLSRYGLDAQPYHTGDWWSGTTWEKCTLRAWLNDEFLRMAFTSKEQMSILLTIIDNSNYQSYSGWDTDNENDTQDKVFLLSYAESRHYLGVSYDPIYKNTQSRVAPTAFAISRGAYVSGITKTADNTAAGWWWLRSPGRVSSDASRVLDVGTLSLGGIDSSVGSIRPALWINLNLISSDL